MTESLQNATIQPLHSLYAKDMPVDVLRLDRVHPVVSGNKWFKLKYYLADALAQQKTTIATFGGAWSNHLVAAAYAARGAGLNSIGFVRGEAGTTPSAALEDAVRYGMEIRYVNRQDFRTPALIRNRFDAPGIYWISEGGYGPNGAAGAADILRAADTSGYSHILCAVGTGTMLSGLVSAALPGQQVIGISVLKNNVGLESAVRALLPDAAASFAIHHQYHFGGYAKHPQSLIDFMNELWATEHLPTDIVYTGKLMYAAMDLIAQNHFPAGARILLVHSGGLQGNRSLPPGTLSFS